MWVIVRSGIEFPDSFEMVKYLDILADGSDKEGFYQGDMTGVGEVEEGLEPHHKVS